MEPFNRTDHTQTQCWMGAMGQYLQPVPTTRGYADISDAIDKGPPDANWKPTGGLWDLVLMPGGFGSRPIVTDVNDEMKQQQSIRLL